MKCLEQFVLFFPMPADRSRVCLPVADTGPAVAARSNSRRDRQTRRVAAIAGGSHSRTSP